MTFKDKQVLVCRRCCRRDAVSAIDTRKRLSIVPTDDDRLQAAQIKIAR